MLPSFLPDSLSSTDFGDMLKAQEEWYTEKEQLLLSYNGLRMYKVHMGRGEEEKADHTAM